MSTSDYKLTIGNVTYTLNQATTSTKLGNVTLTKLTFDKGIYRPGEIHATFTITSTTAKSSDIKSELVENSTDGRLKVSLSYSNKVTYAANYYVFKFRPFFKKVSGATTITVELDIFSQDKLLTFDKYSKAYTGRKLGTYIFKEKMPVSVSSNKDSVSNDLQIISFTDTSKDNTKNEFMQPYLVQYNESYYDFLKRTANRCGEFLYHENGQLNLGMQITDKTADTYQFSDKASEYHFEDIYEGSFSSGSFGYKYLEDADKQDYPYNDPLANDDYLDKIEKNYTSYKDELFDVRRNAAGVICDALNATSMGEIISNMAFSAAFQLAAAGINMGTKNKNNKNVNINPWEGDSYKENWNGEELRQFGTGVDNISNIKAGEATNLYAIFYDSVRKQQKLVGENALILNFEGDLQDLKIGDKIKVESKYYLVIDVKGNLYHNDENNKYVIEQQVLAIPFFETGEDLKNPTCIPIPPMLPDTTIRESKAQPAVVVENLDPKKIGRVRVRFAWQKDDDDVSPWIRISMPFATDGGGIKFMPEPDDEVMIDFIDGNVERPYVCGSLLSPKSNGIWGSLPDRTITSHNGHSITFNDDPGGHQFFANMIPFVSGLNSFIPNDLWPEYDDKGFSSLVGGTTISDRCGFYKIEMNTTTRSILIKSSLGDISLNAFTGISINAPNGDISIKGKNVEIEAANKVSITSGKNISSRYFTDSGLDGNSSKWERFLQASGRSVMDAAYNFTRTTVDHLVSKFYDVTLIRTLIEVFTRPIDGTTSIKSFTFVQVEAGKGSAEYPYEAYRKEHTSKADYSKLEESITTINTEVGKRIKAINDSYSELCTAIKGFADISGTGDNMLNKDGAVISFDTIMTKGWDNKSSVFEDKDFTLDEKKVYNDSEVIKLVKDKTQLTEKPNKNNYTNNNLEDYYRDSQNWTDTYNEISNETKTEINKFNTALEEKKKTVKGVAEKLAAAFATLKKSFEDLALINNDKIYTNEVQTALNTIFDELKGKDGILKTINDKSLTKDSQEDKAINWDDLTKVYRRKAVFKLVAGACSQIAATDKVKLSATYDGSKDVADDSSWKSLVESWVTEPSAAEPKAILDYGGSLFKDGFTKEWLWDTFASPWVDTTYNRRRWATGSNGKILLSDSPDSTISFDATGASKAQKNLIISDKAVDTIMNRIKSL